MKYHFWKYVSIILWVLAFLFLICYMSTFYPPLSLKGKGTEESPYRFSQDRGYCESLTDFAVHDNCIYLLFSGKGVVKCYKTDGTYLHSYYFTQITNGAMSFLCTDTSLYIESRQGNYYGMTNGVVTSFLHWDEDSDAIREIKENSEDASQLKSDQYGAQYFKKGFSIVRSSDGQEEKIIGIPWWTFFFSPLLLWCAFIICFVLQLLIRRRL